MALEELRLSNIAAGKLESTFQEAMAEVRGAWNTGRRGKVKMTIGIVMIPDEDSPFFKVQTDLVVTLPPRSVKSRAVEYGPRFMVDTISPDAKHPQLNLDWTEPVPNPEPAEVVDPDEPQDEETDDE